jgi:hypothetical protein
MFGLSIAVSAVISCNYKKMMIVNSNSYVEKWNHITETFHKNHPPRKGRTVISITRREL